MKYTILIFFIMLFSGCSTTDPVINSKIQQVDVPITVPCKATMPPEPESNFDKLSPDQDIFEKAKALLADRKLSQGYEAELIAALKSCIK